MSSNTNDRNVRNKNIFLLTLLLISKQLILLFVETFNDIFSIITDLSLLLDIIIDIKFFTEIKLIYCYFSILLLKKIQNKLKT
jgi:hypothetical protein